MSEAAFELEAWHVITVVATIVAGIFKEDIKHMLFAVGTVRGQRHLAGKRVQLRAVEGGWEEVTILRYTTPIPFLRAGGVTVRHDARADRGAIETTGFDRWREHRLRMPPQPKEADAATHAPGEDAA